MASRRAGRGPGGLPAAAPARLLLLLLLLLLGPWPAAGHGGKYSREKNEPEPPPKREPGGEFRMEKLNQLWEKARRLHLSPVKLSELHADLKMQERDEFSWKKSKAEGLDEDGEKEAKLIRNLNVILAKYGLDGRKDTQATSNSLNDGAQDDSLGDPRLEKLWHKAKTSGKFSSEELDKLWREFQHHREKVLKYNILLETLSRTEDIQENVISPSDMRHIKEDVLHSRHAELKGRLRDINQGFDRLRKVSHQGYGTTAEFEEPRVIDLWDLARSANFTEKELESFRVRRLTSTSGRMGNNPPAAFSLLAVNSRSNCPRDLPPPCPLGPLCWLEAHAEPPHACLHQMKPAQPWVCQPEDLGLCREEELKHFESKIEKHNHYQKQLEISHQKLKHVESLGDAEHVSRNKEKYALLEEKTKELGYKVKKHLQDLSGRISRARHNEL